MDNIWKRILGSGNIDPLSGTTSTNASNDLPDAITESEIRKAWEQIYKNEKYSIDNYSRGYMPSGWGEDKSNELTELKTEIKSLQEEVHELKGRNSILIGTIQQIKSKLNDL